MGKLRKGIVDMIVKLRNEGFTQIETAEQAGVHVKTVQKYDPLVRHNKQTADTGSIAGMPNGVLEHYLKAVADWITVFEFALMVKDKHELNCPECDAVLKMSDKGYYFCRECGRKLSFPGDIWDFGGE